MSAAVTVEYDYNIDADQLEVTTTRFEDGGRMPVESLECYAMVDCPVELIADALRDVCPDTYDMLAEETDADEWRISFRGVFVPLYQALELHDRAQAVRS